MHVVSHMELGASYRVVHGTILRLVLESMRSGSRAGSDNDEEIARIDHDSLRLEEHREKCFVCVQGVVEA